MSALTRDYKHSVAVRLGRDMTFRQALLVEAVNACLTGDVRTSKAILRDLVSATIGFERLAAKMKKPSKRVHLMLAPHGNPSAQNFLCIVKALEKDTRVRLRAIADAG